MSLTDLCKKISSKKQGVTKSQTSKSKISKKDRKIKSKSKPEIVKVESKEETEIETRKNIHKIITNSKLSKATKTAAQLETERRKRIEDRQKEVS